MLTYWFNVGWLFSCWMVCAGDEQEPVMNLHVHASDIASRKSYSYCLWPKGRADVVVLPLHFDNLADFGRCAACLSLGWDSWRCCGIMCSQALSDRWLFQLWCWAQLAADSHLPWEGSALDYASVESGHLLLTNVVAAALKVASCLCSPMGPEGMLHVLSHGWGLWHESRTPNFLLLVSVRNPVCPPFPLHPAVPRAPHCCLISSCCGQNLLMDPPKSSKSKSTTAFRGFRSRVSDLSTLLGNEAELTELPLVSVFLNVCACVFLTGSFFFSYQRRRHVPVISEMACCQ